MLWVPGINFSSLKIYSVIATSRPDSIGRTHEKSCALVTGQRVSFKFWNMTRARTRRGGSLLPVLFNETLHARWRSAWCTVHLLKRFFSIVSTGSIGNWVLFNITHRRVRKAENENLFCWRNFDNNFAKKCLDHFFEGFCRSLAFDWWGTGEELVRVFCAN